MYYLGGCYCLLRGLTPEEHGYYSGDFVEGTAEGMGKAIFPNPP